MAGVVSSVIVEYSRPDLFVLFGPSEAVTQAADELRPLAEQLLEDQVGVKVRCTQHALTR